MTLLRTRPRRPAGVRVEGAHAAAPTIDVREVNPVGWRRRTDPAVGVLLPADPVRQRAAVAAVHERLGGNRPGGHRTAFPVFLAPHGVAAHGVGPGVVRRLPSAPAARARVLHSLRGVLDLGLLHGSGHARARWLIEVAARGAPLVAEDLDEAAAWLDPGLNASIAGVGLAGLQDEEVREAVSVDQRRAAIRAHGSHRVAGGQGGARAAGSALSVSVLLASRWPGRLEAAVARADRQSHPRVEIVVALHGEEVPPGLADRLRGTTERHLVLLRVPSSSTLGDVLNAATHVASGALVTKMDDDDLYDHAHVEDLVDALHYSGATVVGKGSEYVHLEEIDTTIRRFPRGAESRSRNVAGGTLLLSRDDLAEVGGWQRVARAVDQCLLDDVERAGGRVHRTAGRGFLLCRRAQGHTWDPGLDYFLRQAVRQWRGLARDAAGVA